MDHHALLEELRARRDDPLDFLERFCDEIAERFEITQLEHEAGRYRVAAASAACPPWWRSSTR